MPSLAIRLLLHLPHALEQLRERHAEAVRDLPHVEQGDVPAAHLDGGVVRPVHAYRVGEGLLAHAEAAAQLLAAGSERYFEKPFHGFHIHVLLYVSVGRFSPRIVSLIQPLKVRGKWPPRRSPASSIHW